AAVLLAAGGGTRFGDAGHKLLAPLRGRPLFAWALRSALAADLDALVVVTGAVPLDEIVAEESGDRTVVVHHDRWRDGQAGSLQAGIAWCAEHGVDAAVVGLGDPPFVGPAAWRTVAAATDAPVVTASFGGRRRPPVRLARAVWGLLPREGDDGARVLMRRRPDLVAEVACRGDPVDVDTPEDLRRAEAAGT
ncbi:MAG: nucleotidyltransferase family protein, partial [Acidimicrobiales bacterium]